jgi:outer membrane protein assembly factor BamB
VVVSFDNVQVASHAATSTGAISIKFVVPATAQPGPHTVKATGQASGKSATASLLVRTDWPTFRFSPAGTGSNPVENVIGPGNVSALTQAWTAATGNGTAASPVVAGGVVFVPSAQGNAPGLYAFSAAGTTGCAGAPKVCQPLWKGAVTGQSSAAAAVSGGIVFVNTLSKLFAFSAAGTTNCAGAPKVCQPLWTAATSTGGGSSYTSPVVANGVVYIAHDSKLYAFSAAGATNCSGTPKTCTPLWTATAENLIPQAPTVSGGIVYIGAAVLHPTHLYAFSAAGTTNCSGTPKVCQPLWTATTPGSVSGAPAVANGSVYAGDTAGHVSAFSAAGTTNCSGAPKTCNALWTATNGYGTSGSVAVANGAVYVATTNNAIVSAYSAAGTTNCSGTPKTCTPLWTTSPTGVGAFQKTTPSVANGVLYIGNNNGKVYAYSATGTTNCSATKVCSPLWSAQTTANVVIWSSPAITDGFVYVTSTDGHLYAYHQ